MSNELEAFLEYIQVIKALSKKSCEAYRSDLHQIEKLTKKPLIALDTNATLDALSLYENKRTLNRKLSALNAFFEFCFRSEFVQDRQKVKLAKIPKNLPKFLTYEQIQNGLKTVERSSWLGKRDAALILFLYATGMRITECLNMHRDDIDGSWLRVRHGKGDKERLVPIAKEALALLRNYLSEVPFEKEQIWLNYTGKALSRISAFKITQRYLGISPHVLRHSYATALILGGADLRIVQELLGHSSLLTTQVYTHIQKQNLQDTVLNYHPMA
jgi:integrase/recombinase XerD